MMVNIFFIVGWGCLLMAANLGMMMLLKIQRTFFDDMYDVIHARAKQIRDIEATLLDLKHDYKMLDHNLSQLKWKFENEKTIHNFIGYSQPVDGMPTPNTL
jgi:hypothetical protein